MNPKNIENIQLEKVKGENLPFDISIVEEMYTRFSNSVVNLFESHRIRFHGLAIYTFKGLFETKKKAGSAPLGTWAKFDHIEVKGETAHVLISRKVNLIDADQYLVLSIDLVWEDDRWQVTREVIFARPDESNS